MIPLESHGVVAEFAKPKGYIQAFQPNPPKIDYTVPSFVLDYCGTGNTFTIPITNTSLGTAYDFNLSADFGTLTIANITSPSGASYSGGKFILGDVPNGTTNLTFELVPVWGVVWGIAFWYSNIAGQSTFTAIKFFIHL